MAGEEDVSEREITLDEGELERSLDAKETEERTSEEESSASKETKEETSEETSTSADSLKTEKEEAKEEKEETKENQEENEETRFDKHPRFQQLKQERDEALEKARSLEEFKNTVGDVEASELKKLSEAASLLKKYPELAQKVQKVINEYAYGGEEVNNKFQELYQKAEALENKIFVDKAVNEIEKMISSAKIKEEEEPLLREILGARINRLNIKNEQDIPKLKGVFDKTLNDIEKFRRTNLASHIETKKSEKSIPGSPLNKGKLIPKKEESGELQDVVGELTEGLKASRLSTEKE